MTQRLYLDNSYIFDFDAVVESAAVSDSGTAVVLSQTAFYPETGGQPCDIGTIGNSKVIRVIENENGGIVHYLESVTTSPGEKVRGIIDRDRRLENMRAHTGQHILSQAFIQVAGAETVSAHMGLDESTIELATEALDPDLILDTEKLANSIVLKNVPVNISYHNREELQALAVRRIPDREGHFRIVRIGDFECTACGGTHCARSGEVGIIKIIRKEKIRGHIRIVFLTGFRALEDYGRKHRVVTDLSVKLTCHFGDIPDSIEKLSEQKFALGKEVSRMGSRLFEFEIDELMNTAPEFNGIRIIFKDWPETDLNVLRERAIKVARAVKSAVLFISGDKLLISVSPESGLNAAALAKLFTEQFGGKGGGNPAFAQAGAVEPAGRESFLNAFIEMIKDEIAGK